ncbi:class I SAM-dependent methyltransferase [Streptomyces montanisoli]|uniref:Class I SAM-dependent methyltransferase n=1 Tax=Streptomyces montanisoli TaxID=2798581 RepID=A0A940RWW3_9ACTN|nr:class I SAM-dependent methyltransferase [Streptomyces montanisoli]MBP0460582.1 class I SAM-dependent methyltransferase [Streptomyces montanisoli]
MTARALSFDVVAELYDTSRPGYPPALFDAVEDAAGRPLAGAHAVDVGAGTGIATRSLLARGARVTAVEPGPGMAGRLHAVLPGVPLVRAVGDALPLADACADLVTYAQSWHWTDRARAFAEALRVLRPGGTLALFWNVADQTVPWLAAQNARLRAHGGDGGHGVHGAREQGPLLPDSVPTTHRRVSWSRQVTLDEHLGNLSTHSVFRMLGESTTAAFLTAERQALLDVFPDGTVEEAYVVDLVTTRR